MIKKILIILTLALLMPVLAVGQEEWAIIRVCCAHLRALPKHSSEMVTEAIMGTPLKIIGREGEWYKIQTPDHYESWVHPASVVLSNKDDMRQWRSSQRYVYTAFQGFIYENPTEGSDPVSDIVSGCIVVSGGKSAGKYMPVILPDSRKGYVKKNEVRELGQWANTAPDMHKMELFARQMMGSTYLWGGTSVKGTDCSGFTRIVYFTSGILLMRDASQQAATGEIIPPENRADCKTGDLVFFGNDAGRVNHVGIYLRDGMFIHSAGMVHISSLDQNSNIYHSQPLVSISRILTSLGTEGIMLVKDHEWYFNK